MKRLALALVVLLAACAGGERPEAWTALPLGTKADFRTVYFADARNGWIAGGAFDIEGALVGRTRDGGRTWQFESGIGTTAPGMKIGALHFFDARRGIAAADQGTILVTSDGGGHWAEVQGWSGRSDYLWDLFFLDERTGWAAGTGGVLRTTNGGGDWTRVRPVHLEPHISGRAIWFFDASHGLMVGQHASLLRTSDGGVNWTSIEVPLPRGERRDLWDLFFVDDREGWIVGDAGTLLQTKDGGATWTAHDLSMPDLTFAAIRFADRNHGFIAAFAPNLGRSRILRTVDGGATWTVDAEIAGEELRALFVLDAERAWAIGDRTRPGEQAIYVRGAPAIDVRGAPAN